MKRWMILLAVVMLSWGGLKEYVVRVHLEHGRGRHVAAIAYFTDRADAEARLKDVQTEWPAAKIVPEMFSFKIAGDYACTKYLHEDGHVY